MHVKILAQIVKSSQLYVNAIMNTSLSQKPWQLRKQKEKQQEDDKDEQVVSINFEILTNFISEIFNTQQYDAKCLDVAMLMLLVRVYILLVRVLW